MIDKQNHFDVFERLLSQLSDSRLTDEDIRQLEALLKSDAGLRRRYLDYCQMHAILRSEHGLLTSWSRTNTQHESALSKDSRRRWFTQNGPIRLMAATIAFAAIGMALFIAFRQLPPRRGAQMAVLSKAVGVRFAYGAHGERVPAEGTSLPQGVYELQNGLAEIQYRSGAVLVVRAPATFDLVDESCVRLEQGQLAAHVPKPAIGFRIESPGATVIDMGTDFAVQAVKEKESEVHVFQGEVLVDLHGKKGSSADLLRLVTGEATRVDYFTGLPSGIDLNDQQFVRSLREGESAYGHVVLSMGPAVYYRMEPAGDGTQLIDASANGANAKIHFGRATNPVWAVGRVGAAFTLGGPSQETYGVANEYPQAEGDALAVSAWVYAKSRPRWASIAKNWAGGDDEHGQFHFGLYHDEGDLEAHIVDGEGREVIVRDKVPLPLNSWQHVAFVADGAQLRLYRNGQEVASTPYRGLHRDPRIKALAIGTKLNLAGNAPEERDFNMWDGRLDELAIFNHALNAEQVLELAKLPAAAD